MGGGISINKTKLVDKQTIKQVTDVLVSNSETCDQSSINAQTTSIDGINTENCNVNLDITQDMTSSGDNQVCDVSIKNNEQVTQDLLSIAKNDIGVEESSSMFTPLSLNINESDTTREQNVDQTLKKHISTFITKVQKKVNQQIIDIKNKTGVIKCSPTIIEEYNQLGILISRKEIPGEFNVNTAQKLLVENAVTSALTDIANEIETTQASTQESSFSAKKYIDQSSIADLAKYALLLIFVIGIISTTGILANKYQTQGQIFQKPTGNIETKTETQKIQPDERKGEEGNSPNTSGQPSGQSGFGKKKNKKIMDNPINKIEIFITIVSVILIITEIVCLKFSRDGNNIYTYGLFANVLFAFFITIFAIISKTNNNMRVYFFIPLIIYSIILIGWQSYNFHTEYKNKQTITSEMHTIIRYIVSGTVISIIIGISILKIR